DALVILTDQDGLFTADPRRDPTATLVCSAQAGDAQLEDMAGGAGSAIGRGGMLTKILAAKRAAHSGAHTVIASGHEPDVLLRLFDGVSIGTLLSAPALSLASRKQWLAGHLQVTGKLVLDDGAIKALRHDGKSLLPIGVKQVFGEFQRGAVVACVNERGDDIARGLVNYSADESRRIIGHASHEIVSLLGYGGDTEIIHRDNLVLL
ncbi:MAG: glutamate 5-kinase, partial [Gallionellales bacterium CG03_land_8_20_14_0_80_55_15]